jgi:imidazolonepropionase-like amidohydrolase
VRTILRRARVFDGTGSPSTLTDVVIEGSRIASVGEVEDAKGTVLDLSGYTVMPGLINLHEHLTYAGLIGPWEAIIGVPQSSLLLRAASRAHDALRHGITTVRDLGAPFGVNLVIRDARDAGLVAAPRIAAAGSPIAVTGGHAYEMCVEADGAEGWAAAVRGQIRARADWIKLMVSGGLTRGVNSLERFFAMQPSAGEMRSAVQAAHALGRPVTGHINGPAALKASIEAGVDAIEHGVGITRELAAEMARRNVLLVPTVSVYYRSAERAEAWGRPLEQVSLSREIVARHREGLRHVLEHGVRIGLGTDSIGDLVEEAELLEEIGFPRLQVLRAATLGAAEALGWESCLGSVHAGKAADLLVVEGDPSNDVRDLRRVRHVFIGGQHVGQGSFPISLEPATVPKG